MYLYYFYPLKILARTTNRSTGFFYAQTQVTTKHLCRCVLIRISLSMTAYLYAIKNMVSVYVPVRNPAYKMRTCTYEKNP
jgi:hypothetical protein